ncbi:integrase catalytic domain-containing protein [Trichonephila inaurata madagascariensis]|uniref:Integrase catalytic domain-containing protein n=1 Tax=Trichonephila inaurata madagascariensis TaxID=2747483 RepID=A0A8X7BQ16_9ARAC|nr:integrase catalytic domain-containing protein [Trichonephila inaurata madagascariensis]
MCNLRRIERELILNIALVWYEAQWLTDSDIISVLDIKIKQSSAMYSDVGTLSRIANVTDYFSGLSSGVWCLQQPILGSTIQYHMEKKLEKAKQGRGKYSECIVQKLISSFYLDNCLASVQTQSELDRFIDVATEIMAGRKFYLRGWEHSNPSDPIASPTNVLGMIWDRHWDTLLLNFPDMRELMEEVITKRNILAASHKVFVPLEITGPVLLLPKLWLQSLWKSQIGLDQEDIKKKTRFSEIKLAFSAVVFLRVDIGSTVHIQLVQSKTRIAPCGKKETTIARLELLGAAISARLSTTVLKDHVQEIRKLTPVKHWRHVPGSLNSADCPSRGCSAKQLCNSKWWEDPSWSHLSPQEWSISDVEVDINEV